jgi:ferric-dicitrate binding protein FerR (iron transport regulator)
MTRQDGSAQISEPRAPGRRRRWRRVATLGALLTVAALCLMLVFGGGATPTWRLTVNSLSTRPVAVLAIGPGFSVQVVRAYPSGPGVAGTELPIDLARGRVRLITLGRSPIRVEAGPREGARTPRLTATGHAIVLDRQKDNTSVSAF